MFSGLFACLLIAVVAQVLAGPALHPRQAYMNGLHSLLNNNGLSGMSNAITQAQGTPQGQLLLNQVSNGGPHSLVAPANVGTIAARSLYASNSTTASNSTAASNSTTPLVQFLSYHFLNSSVTAASLGAGNSVPSSLLTDPTVVNLGPGQGQVQVIKKTDEGEDIIIFRNQGVARVTKTIENKDLNIVVHVIDNPLATPGNVSSTLTAPLVSEAPHGFHEFIEALESTDFDDGVNKNPKTTLLVPINEAFEDLEHHRTRSESGKGDDDELKEILRNHIIQNTVFYSTEFGQPVTASSNKELKFISEGGQTYVQMCDKKVKVLRSDVPTANGVLHVVDGLLM